MRTPDKSRQSRKSSKASSTDAGTTNLFSDEEDDSELDEEEIMSGKQRYL